MALLSLLFLLLAVNSASSARIAGYLSIGGSGYIHMRHTMEELASRGHEVAVVVPSSLKIKPSDKVAHKIYQVPYKPGFIENELFKLDLEGRKFQFFLKMSEIVAEFCESALKSTKVLEDLKGFDLFIYDSMSYCGALIAERFDIPTVETLPAPATVPFGFVHMIPMPVSYLPQLLTGFTDEMTFVERLMNLVAYLVVKASINLIHYRKVNALKVKYNIKPERSIQEAIAGAEMVIIGADFAVEYPQPLLPGQVMVGPLNLRADVKPLPPYLEEFVSNSGGHGFIIVAFGTNVVSLPQTEVVMLATAFGKLKQRVVWRLTGYIPPSLGPNIKVMEWLPQNDLLAHKDIRAFVSHVGHNSLYESAYHGVPIVAFPLFGDQHSNAKKVVHLGLGLAVHHQSTNAQLMFETIERVVSESRFKTKAMQFSGLLKDRRRTPIQEACDWLEYVLRHGGAQHLRPQVFNIPWYQYYLLDVIAFLVAIVTLVVLVIRLTCKCLCRLCCKKSNDKDKRE